MDLQSILTVAGTFTVVMVLVSQIVKMFVLDPRWVAVFSIVGGMVLVPLAYLSQGTLTWANLYIAVLAGFFAGASAVGLYEGQRAITSPRVG